MIVKLLTEHHLTFLSIKEGCTGFSESTLVKMSNCWKSHVRAQIHMKTVYTGRTNMTNIATIYEPRHLISNNVVF